MAWLSNGHASAVLDEELHNLCVAILRCPPQRAIVTSVDVCAVLNE
jgi:hypothetical protein